MHIETLAGEQSHGLVKRQADDIGEGPDHLDNERASQPLRGITPRLSAPFARGDLHVDFGAGQPLEAHTRFHQALAQLAARRGQADAGIDPVRAA